MNKPKHPFYSVCMLYVCAMLVDSVTSVALERPGDVCIPEMCWSTATISDRCVSECERLAMTDGHHVDEPSTWQVIRRAPSSFVRIGKSGVVDGNKRYSSFERVGRPALDHKRYSSFVRIGRAGALADGPQRRANDDLSPALNKRRYSSFVRIGRNAD